MSSPEWQTGGDRHKEKVSFFEEGCCDRFFRGIRASRGGVGEAIRWAWGVRDYFLDHNRSKRTTRLRYRSVPSSCGGRFDRC